MSLLFLQLNRLDRLKCSPLRGECVLIEDFALLVDLVLLKDSVQLLEFVLQGDFRLVVEYAL